MVSGVIDPRKQYPPGGRDWQFRWPDGLEWALRAARFVRLNRWVYGHWPTKARVRPFPPDRPSVSR